MKTVSIIGPGRLGGALATALSRAGYSIDNLIYRSAPPSDKLLAEIKGRPRAVPFDEITTLDTGLILLTAPDTELEFIAGRIASKIAKGAVLLHTSGALSSSILAPAAARGIAAGSVHPLVSVSDPLAGAGNFAGAFFCVEGEAAAVDAAKEVVGALGGTPFSIETRFKPLYHASAVLASGHLTSLFSAAAEALSRCGVDPGEAQRILLPLAESAVSNLSKQDPAAALTGPFARTDIAAVERHLEAFDRAQLDTEKMIYLELGLRALELAERNGGDAGNIGRIRNAIKLAQDRGK